MVRLSVIIPVYNVENYLSQCMDSVCGQTFEDIEIICVNDGSTDKSLDILKDHQKKDSRIQIISQENKGQSASRNIGLNMAKGEYIYFMDSDDYLVNDAFEQLFSFCKDKEFDFIMFKIIKFDDDTLKEIDDNYYSMPYLKERVGMNSFDYSDVDDMALELCVNPQGKLFRHDFIRDIRFPEGLIYEDNVFFTHALFKADNIYFYDEFLLNKRRHSTSTTSSISIKSLDTIEITNMLLDLCEEYGHPKHKKELYYRIFHNIYQIFKKADESQKEEFFKKIKHDYLKSKAKWESDDYFKNKLKAKYKHIYKCCLKSKNADKFESCVDNFKKQDRFKKLRNMLS